MRKFYTVLLFLLVNLSLFSQTNTNPLPAGTTKIGGHLSAGVSNEVWTDATGLYFNYRGNAAATHFWNLGGGSGKSIMSLLSNGSVGIGISNPESTSILHLKQLTTDAKITLESADANNSFINFSAQNSEFSIGFDRTANNKFVFAAYGDLSANKRLIIDGNGNIGIGTTSPEYKLDVLGTIRARELKVDMQGADFVFEEDYPLRPISELEDFVKTNKHLPEIAPAKEMQVNGVNQSEMNQKLLQKIEELSLYVIELNKSNVALKKRVEELEQK